MSFIVSVRWQEIVLWELSENSDETVLDAFIMGLQSNIIWQCLLENSNLDLVTMLMQTRSLDTDQRNPESFCYPILLPSLLHRWRNRGAGGRAHAPLKN